MSRSMFCSRAGMSRNSLVSSVHSNNRCAAGFAQLSTMRATTATDALSPRLRTYGPPAHLIKSAHGETMGTTRARIDPPPIEVPKDELYRQHDQQRDPNPDDGLDVEGPERLNKHDTTKRKPWRQQVATTRDRTGGGLAKAPYP